MTGTIINIIAVLAGSGLGITIGNRLPDKIHETILRGIGLVVLVLGMQLALTTQNPLIVLASIGVGGVLGEWWNIDGGLKRLGAWLEARFNPETPVPGVPGVNKNAAGDEESIVKFIGGFVTASLVFEVGPLTILGSIQDGLKGDYRLLAIKSMLDFFTSLALSSSLGIGVAFSALTILVYQGALALLAGQAQALLTPDMQTEMFATGGVMLLGLGIGSLLEIKPIRTANFLPALILAPLIVAILAALGLPVAPKF